MYVTATQDFVFLQIRRHFHTAHFYEYYSFITFFMFIFFPSFNRVNTRKTLVWFVEQMKTETIMWSIWILHVPDSKIEIQ